MQTHNHSNSLQLLIIILLSTLFLSSINLAWTSYEILDANIELTSMPGNFTTTSVGYFIYDQNNNSFLTYGGHHNFRLRSDGITVILPAGTADVQFLGTSSDVHISGQNLVQAKANYFIGNDPAQWQLQAPMYTEVVYPSLYPGIDLVYSLQNGQLKSDFYIHPNADISRILIQYTDQTALSLQDNALDIRLPSGEILHEHIPGAYQDIDGQRQIVHVDFQLLNDTTYTFALQEGYNPEYPLIIDPILIYNTYVGGSGQDEGWAIAIDKTGASYITGITRSVDFPMTQPEQHASGNDVFVAKIDAQGQLAYVSIFGGFSGEEGNGIAIDDAGNAYIGGETFSTDFPLLNAWQPYFAGYEDAFILKVDSQGNLVYSTYLGGSRGDEIDNIYADSAGNVYVGGEVYSDDFPLVTPWSNKVYGVDDEDGFISILDAHGVLIYSTYISAPKRDQVFRIAVDQEGYVYGTGMTSSSDFPLVNPYQSAYGGDWDDCFVFKLDPWTNTMIYSTFLGGVGRDECWGLAVDAEGAAYVTGFTLSTNFPLTNAIQSQHHGDFDAFVTKLAPTGNTLDFSTFIGGSDKDWAWGLDLDDDANVYITGETYSPDFPLYQALQPHHGGEQDAFLLVLTSEGILKYSSFLGGSDNDRGWRLTVDQNWLVHITGSTDSHDFPLQAPYQNHLAGQADAFVASFGLIPTPTPTPTPTPYASTQIGPAGGSLWLSYPAHLTLLQVPPGALSATTTFELTYDGRSNNQGALQGLNHFFSLSIEQPQNLQGPLQLHLAYQETRGVIATTLELYRLDGNNWVTSSITITEQYPYNILAWVQQPGIYGILGQTNRVYLPLVLRQK